LVRLTIYSKAQKTFFLGAIVNIFNIAGHMAVLHLVNSASLWQDWIHKQYGSEPANNNPGVPIPTKQAATRFDSLAIVCWLLIYSCVWRSCRLLLCIYTFYLLHLFVGEIAFSCWFVIILFLVRTLPSVM
jgi:hypothetical protein